MRTPVTPKEWAFQIALSALIALVVGFFYPEKRGFLAVILVGLAVVSWVIMMLSMRRHRASLRDETDESD